MAVTAFDEIEVSNEAGEPIRLYEFHRGSQYWRYNTSDRDVVRDGHTWLGGDGHAISDEGIRQSNTASQDELKVTLPSGAGIATIFQLAPPSSTVWLRIRDTHASTDVTVVSWVGTVTDVQRPVPGTVIFVCQNITVSLSRSGLRLSWGRSCPYSLYDPRTCRVNKNTFAVGAVVQSMSGITIGASAAAGHADGHFDGGFLEWVVERGAGGEEDVLERRGIETHAGAELRLLSGTSGMTIGQSVVLYPGCRRTIAVCKQKFNNVLNYGGVPGLPGKSPFDGNPVF